MLETSRIEYDNMESCPLCGNRGYKLLFFSHDRRFGLPGDFPVVRCADCALVRLNRRPKQSILQSYYPSDYPAYLTEQTDEHSLKSHLRGWGVRVLFRSHYDLEIAKSRSSSSNPRILDVGCGAGQALTLYRNWGWKTFGVEISTLAAQQAAEHGHAILCGTLEEAHYESNHFHLVRARHVLEHLPNPIETLLEMHRVLRDDGMLAVEVPNWSAVWAKIFRKWYWQIDSPRHCCFFTQSTLVRALEMSDFKLKKMRTCSTLYGVDSSLFLIARESLGEAASRYSAARAVSTPLRRLVRLLSLLPSAMFDGMGKGENIVALAEKR